MRDYGSYKSLVVERSEAGDVLTLTMNGPEIKNAATAEMHTEISEIFKEIRSDDDARVVVFTGAGEIFSHTADLAWYSRIDSRDWIRLMREAKQMVHDMLALPQPLVIRMNGDAIGLGSSYVSLGDFIVAVAGSKVGDHHLGMGLVCGDGGAMTYPFSMGMHRAKEFFLLGREFTVEELHEMGVVTKVVPRDQLDAAVKEVVDKLLESPKEALEFTKMTLNRMMQFSSFLSTDFALGHEGWTWYLPASQKFLADMREEHPAR